MTHHRFARLSRFSIGLIALAAYSAAGAAETVTIGFIDVLSGPFAQTGAGSLAQLREVVSQLNDKAKGDDSKFEVVPFESPRLF